MKILQRFFSSCLALTVVLVGLAGCGGVTAHPKVADAPFTRGEEFISLHCNRDQSVTAMVVLGNLSQHVERGKSVALHSEDQGLTWRMVDLGAGADNMFVSLVALPAEGRQSEDVLYASGYELKGFSLLPSDRHPGPWWKSTDGGRSWAPSHPLYRLPLSDSRVPASGLRPIVVADEQGTLLTIVNGIHSQDFHSLRLPDTLLRSTDGGNTWKLVPSHNIERMANLLTNGRGHAVMAATPLYGSEGSAMIFWSNDSGATWTQAKFPVTPSSGGADDPAFGLYGNPDQTLIAFTRPKIWSYYRSRVYRSKDGGRTSRVYRSEDGGRTWKGPLQLELQLEPKSFDYIEGMTGDGTGRVAALLGSGAVVVSDDWGKTWVRLDPGFQISSLISAGNGILIGTSSHGRFTRSTDWGKTWHTVDSQLPDRGYGLGGCTDGHGLIVVGGSSDMLTRSTDWGATWQRARMADKP